WLEVTMQVDALRCIAGRQGDGPLARRDGIQLQSLLQEDAAECGRKIGLGSIGDGARGPARGECFKEGAALCANSGLVVDVERCAVLAGQRGNLHTCDVEPS